MKSHLVPPGRTVVALMVLASIAGCTSDEVTSVTEPPLATSAPTVPTTMPTTPPTVPSAPVDTVPPAEPIATVPVSTIAATVPPTTPPPVPPPPVRVLVTNDDGYSSEGIDQVVEALLAIDTPVFDVVVVAPLTQQSGQGGNFTDGPVNATNVTTLSGHPAIAVEGFPADAVRWALDQGGLDFVPDFVISGANEGQNLGPFVDLSGTVGAARAAAVRNVPAIAVSTGFASFDHDATTRVLLRYLARNIGTLLAHEEGAPVASVISINVPSCSAGEVRGLVEVPLGTDIQGFDYAADVDCTSTAENPADDVQAFFNGFAALSPTPLEPAPTPTPEPEPEPTG